MIKEFFKGLCTSLGKIIGIFIGLIIISLLITKCNVKAEDYVLPTPTNICSDYTGSPSPPSSGTFCNKGSTTMWWDNPFYLDSYMSGLSGESVIYNKSFIFNNINLCKGKNVYIEYELGGLFGLFQRTLQYTTSIDGNNLVCNIELIDTSHVKLRCSGVGGSDLIIGVRMIDSITGGHYELGLSKKINAYCDVSNSDVIVNNKNDTQDIINNNNQNTNDIINNQNKNQKETTDAIKENTETQKGILQTLINLPKAIMDLLGDLLKSLIVPKDDFFTDWFTKIQEAIDEKLGVLAIPFDLLTSFIDVVDDWLEETPTHSIEIPNIGIYNDPLKMGTSTSNNLICFSKADYIAYASSSFYSRCTSKHTIIIQATTLEFDPILKNSVIKVLYTIYNTFITFYIMLGFFKYCRNKYSEVIGGDIDNTDYLIVEEGVTHVKPNDDGGNSYYTHKERYRVRRDE